MIFSVLSKEHLIFTFAELSFTSTFNLSGIVGFVTSIKLSLTVSISIGEGLKD